MRIPRIYTTQPLIDKARVELEAAPSQHVCRALRLGAGDPLVLFNGNGGEHSAVIVQAQKKTVVVELQEHREAELESPLHIHLGIGASRGERMDWIVQKSTELGIASITPLFTQRCEVKLSSERAAKKHRHWEQIAISACEQCGRNRLPVIHPLIDIAQWTTSVEAEIKLVLHHRADAADNTVSPGSVALLIGPEGGLAEAEIDAAEKADFQSLRLGPRILRTETAPLAAVAILQARWGDMAV